MSIQSATSRSWIAEELTTRVRAALAQAISLRLDEDLLLVPTVEQQLDPSPRPADDARDSHARRLWKLDDREDTTAYLNRVWWEEAEDVVRDHLTALTVNVDGDVRSHGFFPETTDAAAPELVGIMYGDRTETLRTALDLHRARVARQMLVG